MEQFRLPLEDDAEDVSLKERYKLAIGQAPEAGMTDEQMIRDLEDPEATRLRLLSKNRAEDKEERDGLYRRG